MSHLLDTAARQDEQRRKDLDADDAQEKARIASDLAYLERQTERRKQWERQTADMERCVSDRLGWGA